MSYERQNFQDGQVLKAEHLIKMEDGIEEAMNTSVDNAAIVAAVDTHNAATDAHNDIRLLIEGLTTRLNAIADSEDIDLDQFSEIVAYIKANKSLIESVTTNKVSVADIINDLTTNVSDKPLSAAQGVALKALIDALDTNKVNSSVLANYAMKNDIPEIQVQSVNGKKGVVELSAEDVGARPETWTPNASDVGADPKGTAQSATASHNTDDDAHNDIRLLIEGLTTRINALANSTDEDLDQMAELVAYIKSNKDLIDGITTSKVNVTDIVNNLTTNVANKPLSAAQGVALKALIDAITVPTKLSELTNDKGYLTGYTETDPTVPAWAKKDTKPSYTASEVNADPAGAASAAVSAHNTDGAAHADIREEVSQLSAKKVDKIETLTAENEDPVLGAELASASGWTSTGWTGDFASGFTHTSGNTNALSFTIPGVAVGKEYVIEFTSTVSYTNTNLLVTIGAAPAMLLYGMNANKTRVGVVAVDTGKLTFTPESAFTGKISGISVREITGVSTPTKTTKDSSENVVNEVRHVGESLFVGVGVGGKTVLPGMETMANLAIGGRETFKNNISGFWNVALGVDCMQGNVSGSRNVSIGANNMRNNVEGSRNVAIGNFCMTQAKGAHRNVAIGGDCMSTATGGEDVVAIGFQALYANTTGKQNVAIGSGALSANTTGLGNVGFGYNALNNVTTGRTNVAIGFAAGKSLKTGNGNIVIGANCDVSAASYYALNIGNLLKGSVQSGSAYLLINGGLRLPSLGTAQTDNSDVYAEEWTFTLEDDTAVTKKVLLV